MSSATISRSLSIVTSGGAVIIQILSAVACTEVMQHVQVALVFEYIISMAFKNFF